MRKEAEEARSCRWVTVAIPFIAVGRIVSLKATILLEPMRSKHSKNSARAVYVSLSFGSCTKKIVTNAQGIVTMNASMKGNAGERDS